MCDRTIQTPLQALLKIKHPVLLAGMANVATANLAAAVSNAGGLGVIGGVTLTPERLRSEIAELKAKLDDKSAFGVDLLIPQVGGGARKTNYDYTHGKLPELVDVICEAKPRLFVSAVGVPPKWVVDRLHAAGILVGNMAGHAKHAVKAMAVGADMIIAQGYEAGGHTGDIATMVLIPQVLDAVAGHTAPLHGGPVTVIAAGGIYDGRTAAAAFALGAAGVWVGTRFVAAEEATCSKLHKQKVVESSPGEQVRTLLYTGRPCRMYAHEYLKDWETNRKGEMEELLAKGVIPFQSDMGKENALAEMKKRVPDASVMKVMPLFMGQAAGGIHSVLPAKVILETMMQDASNILTARAAQVA
eukprot:gene2665-4145_t